MAPIARHSPGRQRETNSEQVLRTLVREGALSRVDLAHYTGLTTAAITNITRELIQNNLLTEKGPARSGRVGASGILLDFPDGAPLIGVVHQAVTSLRIGLCNLRGQLLVKSMLPTPQPYTPDWAVETITQQLHILLAAAGFSQDTLLGIGVGLSGLVDRQQGIVKRAPSFGWENVPFCQLLSQHFSCPIIIENNVRGMAFGEALFGAGREWSDFAFVYLGIGIGAGLIINGHPYRGTHDGAGEIGHLTVEADGDLCKCGNRGCLETISAEPAIAHDAQQKGLTFSSPESEPKNIVRELVAYASQADPTACEIIRNCGESLGIALSNLVDLFNPGHIVLHGLLTEASDIFFPAVSDCIQRRAFLAHDEVVQLVTPTFKYDAGLVGAAAIALDAFVLTHGSRNNCIVERGEATTSF